MLSAQCTDIMVNRVTEKLFRKYKSIKDYANADSKQLEEDIRSTGFYHNNAKKPKCDVCFLNDVCPSSFKFPQFRSR